VAALNVPLEWRVADICIVTTEQQREDALAVRIAVFVEEQGIAREDEIDEYDDVAIHCVGYLDGAPVAAGRLVVMDGYGKVGRMAVLSEHRGRGIGAAVLVALEREGVARGVTLFRLSAQLTARPFYDRAGYAPVGDVYDEVGIPHIAMEKRFRQSRAATLR
jgi:predicted GNAT family N-acyltransferase